MLSTNQLLQGESPTNFIIVVVLISEAVNHEEGGNDDQENRLLPPARRVAPQRIRRADRDFPHRSFQLSVCLLLLLLLLINSFFA